MRARFPDRSGTVDRDGVEVYWELHGDDPATTDRPTYLFLPTWSIVHSRVWRMQLPYLALHGAAITFDGRGNGRSGRPQGSDAYLPSVFADDALAVLDAVGAERVVAVGLSAGAFWLLDLMDRAPERLRGAVFIAPALAFGSVPEGRDTPPFDERPPEFVGWARYNRHAWLEDYDGFVHFFMRQCFSEPHSSKPIDDAVAWARETTPDVLLDTRFDEAQHASETVLQPEGARRIAREFDEPVLVLHGSDDHLIAPDGSVELAELTGGRLLVIDGGGHVPAGRDPVRVNLELRAFAEGLVAPGAATASWPRARARPQRVLFVSSPIGLGHIQRDLAIVRELRRLRPGLEVHWWAQHPVTQVLEQAGEYVHPASHAMASESRHWENESRDHELHAFYAFRRMDEILATNFMLFRDLVAAEPYDLWIGDESWEVDHFLHENPEEKRAPYVFLTDVIGFLPVDPDGDPREVELTADYNAEMIAQRARYPWVRDLSLYVGEYDDLPDASFGPGLPRIRDWARTWFEEVGYVLPFDPAALGEPRELRGRLGHPSDGPLYVAAVGGTAVGAPLLERVAYAFDALRARRPDARMLMVTGPRIDPNDLPAVPRLDKRAYVHDLYEHLAAADAAVVQGGLSTTMELVAARRPFTYLPLRKHWEQLHHVRARLDRHGVTPPMDFASADPDGLSEALEALPESPARYAPVPRDGAARAALRIATLLGSRPG